MNIVEFVNLPEYKDLTEVCDARVGMRFLHGSSVVAQKDCREIGQVVSYYEINHVDKRNPKNFSYTMKMEKLTRPTEEQ